jgi:branched-chain amino acid transport system substrate-binding protein
MVDFSSRRLSRREFGQTGLAALGGLAFAACSSGTAPAKTGAAPAGGAPAGQAQSAGGAYVPDRTLKVGIVVPQSGVYASTGASALAGIRLGLKEFEDKGWRFELVMEDSKGEATTALRLVQKYIERDQVNFILGPLSSGELPALRDPVDQAKVIMSTYQAANRDITGSRCSRYIFRTTPTNYMQGYGLGPWIYRNVGKRGYVLTADYAAGTEIADAIVEGFTKEGGEVVAYAKAPLTTTDFAPYMAPILDSRADFVTGFFAGKNAIDVVKAFQQFGVKDRMKIAFSGYLTSNDLIEAQGQAETEGIYEYLNFSESLDTPEYTAWAAKLTQQSPEITRVPVYAMHGYTATRAVLLGIEQARSLKSEDIADAMEKVEFAGPVGPIRFDPSHQSPLDFYVTQVQSMRHVVLDKVPNQRDPEEADCRRTW